MRSFTVPLLAAFLLLASPSSGAVSSQCIQPDRIAAGLAPFSGNFCTANDLTFVLIGLGIQQDGCFTTPDSANVLNLRAIVENTGAATRYDAGLWISAQGNVTRCSLSGQFCTTDAQCSGGQNVCVSTARWGGCVREFLREPAFGQGNISCTPTTGGVNLSCGGAPPPTATQGPYINDDGDGCGDVRKFGTGGPPDCGRTVDLRIDPSNSTCAVPDGTQDQTVFDFDGAITLPCVDSDGNGFMEIPTCTSWGQSAADIVCTRRQCSGGTRNGQQCVVTADCPGGTCALASTCNICTGSGASCTTNANCPSGQICRGACSNTGSYCATDADCGGASTCNTRTCQGSGDPCTVAPNNCPTGQLCTVAANQNACRTQRVIPGTSAKCNCEDGLNSNVPVASLSASCTCNPPTTVRPGFPVTCNLTYNNPQPPNCTPSPTNPERYRCGTAAYLRFDLDDGIGGAASGAFAGLCSGGQGFCSVTTSTNCSTNNDCPMGETCEVPTCNTDADCPAAQTCSLASALGAYGGTPAQLQWVPRSISGSTLGIAGAGDTRTLTFTYTPSSSAPSGPISLALTTLYSNKTCSTSQTLCETDSQCPMGQTCVLDFTVDPRVQPVTTSCNLDVNATHATVASFSAHVDRGRVAVEWQTASEVGTVGFELERLDPKSGEAMRVTDEMLPAAQHAPGASYRFVDELAPLDEELVYRLIEIDRHDQRSPYGPFAVRLASEPRNRALAKAEGADERFLATAKGPSPGHAERVATARIEAAAQRVAKRARAWERVRVEVGDTGLYFLSAAEIAAAWGARERHIARDIAHGRLRLSAGGAEVAWEAAEGGLLFYGQAIDSQFARHNVYWLDRSGGTRFAADAGTGPAPAGGALAFRDRVHFEQDLLGRPIVATDPDDDYWFWTGVIGSGLLTFDLELEDVAAGAGSRDLTVGLWGFSTGTGATAHSAAIELNGQMLGQIDFSGDGSHVETLAVDQSLLVEGSNTLRVLGLGGSFFVDSFDLEYDRLYRASSDRLLARGDGHPVITVSGFSSDRIRVYDVSDPAAPRRLDAITVGGGSGDFSVSFAPAAAATPYYVVADPGWRAPAAVEGVSTANLRHATNAAEYLVIAPAALMAPAEALAEHRRSRGLLAMSVDLADVMAEFNDGVSHPEAIRDFLAHAHANWRVPPRYVALAGKGSYDYRDLLGLGGNLMPPLMAPVQDGLVPSDSTFGDLVGDDRRPEMAIGRLPAVTAQELADMVEKIKAYELSGGGVWTGRTLLAADNADAGGDFATDSDVLAAGLPGALAVARVYLGQPYTPAGARQALFDGIDQGALFLNYTGHGGFDRFASEGILLSSDVAGLANEERAPLVTALTCNIGMFAFPGFTSLGETLALHGAGGAIAVWSPMGLSLNFDATRMGDRLIATLFAGAPQRPLGEALLEALDDYLAQGGNPEMLTIYGLLGDPALIIQSHTAGAP